MTTETPEMAAAWEALCNAPGGPPRSKEDPLALLRASAMAEWRRFAAQHKQLRRATEDVQQASYLLDFHMGMWPTGTQKRWAESIETLLELAGRNMDVLDVAFRKAREASDIGLTFAGPWSVQNYVRDEARRRRYTQRPLLDVPVEGDRKRVEVEI